MVFILYSVKIASFPEYTGYLINHLLQYKLFHWDRYNSHTHQWSCSTHACYSTIRELSSQSLHRLVAIAPDLMKDTGTLFVNSQTVKKGVIFEHSEMTRAQPRILSWGGLPQENFWSTICTIIHVFFQTLSGL